MVTDADADAVSVGRIAALRIRAGRYSQEDAEALAEAYELLTRLKPEQKLGCGCDVSQHTVGADEYNLQMEARDRASRQYAREPGFD